ncbi:MAG: D-alanyl-D-alanine carboxypeptidase/D-alanyl-D-alanine-endopeptidase (penicillin-binding protein 4) [bacterium]|jgi:D-alanyl-D-alanine carboxypeptidase/D-alanyl-D-alanine-endopeptidase (penicillin-binding protein 4)
MIKNFFLLLLFILPLSVQAKNQQLYSLEKQIKSLMPGGILIFHDEKGKPILQINSAKKTYPASLFKIPLAQVAIELLGENYRFKTQFYQNSKRDLLIQGFGDPFLVSEEIAIIAKQLKKKGITKIRRIYLDPSKFANNIRIPGVTDSLNPYDALNGALIVNFNTINIQRTKSGKILSAEKETPLTPLAKEKGILINKGTTDRINLGFQKADHLRYAGELFEIIFQKYGIQVQEKFSTAHIQKKNHSWKLVYTHRNSRKLHTILKGLLRYSNNFIANQIYIILGTKKYKFPATRENGTKAIAQQIYHHWKIAPQNLVFDEGSGISKNTIIKGKTMIQIMERFRKYHFLLAKKYGVYIKSGTLTGVYNYAGYIPTKKGLRPYIILMTQQVNQRYRVLRKLKKYSQLWSSSK